MHTPLTTTQLILFFRTTALFLLLAITPSLFAQETSTYEEAVVKADKYYKQKEYLDAKAYYQTY